MSDFPSVRPSLNLNFARTKKLDPRVTFRRASTGTYVDSDGLIKTASIDQPRFDHDPVTGVCKGLLVEESKQNLALRSQELDDASWQTVNATVGSNAASSPAGDATADLLYPSSTGSARYINQIPGATGTPSIYTFSVFAKAAGKTCGFMYLQNAASNGTLYFDLSDATLQVVAGSSRTVTGTITAFGNGWYRITCTNSTGITFNGTSGNGFGVCDAKGSQGVTASGTSGIYFWGAQLETGAFPTSYIPTAGSTVTRSADVASITGANFSSWFNSAQGSFFINAENYGLASAIKRLAYDGTWNHAFALGTGTPSASRVMTPYYIPVGNNTVSAGQFFYNGGGTDFGAGIANQIPFGSNVNKMSMYMDIPNKRYAIASAGKLGTLNTDLGRSGADSYRYADMMRVGYNSDYYGTYNGAIAQITYWPQRLTNSQLLALIKS